MIAIRHMGRKLGQLALAAIVVVAFTACAQNAGNKEIGGTLLGAAAGGLLGAQFGKGKGQLAAVAAGALLGAWARNGSARLNASRTPKTAKMVRRWPRMAS